MRGLACIKIGYEFTVLLGCLLLIESYKAGKITIMPVGMACLVKPGLTVDNALFRWQFWSPGECSCEFT